MLVPLAALAAEYPDNSRWEYTIGGFELQDEIIGERPGAIVATGSSSMRFWRHRIGEDLAPLTIVPRGFGGSNMNDVLQYLDALVLKHDPRAVMIYEGDNDVAQGVPVETILATFETVVARIAEHDPATRIYLLSVKPSLSRAALWPEMMAVNAGLEAMAAERAHVTYVDVATPMLHADGSIREDLFVSDGLHMNQAGYDLWRNVVAPVLIANEIRHEPTPSAR
jgi:lysophospholipase L1-like esterase